MSSALTLRPNSFLFALASSCAIRRLVSRRTRIGTVLMFFSAVFPFFTCCIASRGSSFCLGSHPAEGWGQPYQMEAAVFCNRRQIALEERDLWSPPAHRVIHPHEADINLQMVIA